MKRSIKDLGYLQEGAVGMMFLFLMLVLLALLGIDYGYIFYSKNCSDISVGQCVKEQINPPFKEITPTPVKTPITATGSFSVKKYNVQISATFPPDGGAVYGTFSGTCEGNITGTYAGGEGGTISGKAVGSCTPLLIALPASAEFSGTVNQVQKSIPITGTGSTAGISGTGSLTLTY